MAIDDGVCEQDFAGLIYRTCYLPSSIEPSCLVHPEGDIPFAVAGDIVFQLRLYHLLSHCMQMLIEQWYSKIIDCS